MSQLIRGRGGHLHFPIGPKRTQTWWRTLISCFLSNFVEFRSAVSKKSKMYQPIRGRGDYLGLSIGPYNANLVEDIMIMLPFNFRQIPFRGFREEGDTVSSDQRPAAILFFPIGPKNTNVLESTEILLPIKFRWIQFSGFREEVDMFQPIRGRGDYSVSWVIDRPQ